MAPNTKPTPKLCPSSPLDSEALLLGRVADDGSIKYAGDPVKIGDAFVEKANQGSLATTRFRFAAPCVKSGCSQWKRGGCTVVNKVLDKMKAPDANDGYKLPKCGIRQDCRWFSQSGIDACRVCNQVVTDTYEPA